MAFILSAFSVEATFAQVACKDYFDPRPVEIRGLPDSARKLSRVEKTKVFRHYTHTAEDLIQILDSETLKAGPAPYVEVGFERKRYVDLTGVFFTDVDFVPGAIGLDSKTKHFVDFRISPDVEVFEIAKGIYLAPGSPGVRPWVKKLMERADADPSSLNSWEQKAVSEARSQFSETPLILPIQTEDNSLAQSTHAIAQDFLSKRGKPAAEKDLSYGKDIVKVESEGIPARARLLKEEEVANLVFRHYSLKADLIRETSMLKAGTTPYVESQGERFWIGYVQLKGIFMTTKEFLPKQVGVFPEQYVDFKIDPKIAVLELEPGIYLIPSNGKPLSISIKILERGRL